MRRVFLVLTLALFCVSSTVWAYRSSPPSLAYKVRRHRLTYWFKRDLLPVDPRYQVVLVLKEIRSYLARAEALGLSSAQKAALAGLKEALEKDMEEALKDLKRLARQLEEEIKRQDFDEERCLKIQEEMNARWAEITNRALRYLAKARKIVGKREGPR